MNNIKNRYQHAGKCDDQQNLKDIIDAAILSTPEEITYVSPSLRKIPTTVKKTSARKSICLFTNILDVEKKTSKHRVGYEKYKRRAIKVGNNLCTRKKTKRAFKNK